MTADAVFAAELGIDCERHDGELLRLHGGLVESWES
jgi:hypothetical protein